MAMCKECSTVVGINEIENGICKVCIEKGFIPEIEKEISIAKDVQRSDFANPFSFRGKSGRLNYLVYGVLLSYSLIIGGFIVGAKTDIPSILYIFVFLGAVMALASTVRRARDRGENIVLVILLSLVPYVGFAVLLFLLLAPGKENNTKAAEMPNDDTVEALAPNVSKESTK